LNNVAAEPTKRSSAGLFLLIVAFFSFILLGLPIGLRGVAWKSIYPDLGTTVGALGIWLSAETLGYLISSFGNGRLLAWLGMGRALALGCALMGAGIVGIGLAPSWPLLVLIAVGAGFGAGTLDAGMNTFIAVNYPPNVMYWLHASFGIGTTIGPQVVAFIVEQQKQSWRLGYWFAGGLLLALALLIALTMPMWTRGKVQPDSGNILTHKTRYRDTLRKPAVWLSVMLFFVYAGIEFTPNEWGFLILTQPRQLDAQTAANWMSLFWGAFTLGRILPGFVTRYLPERAYMRSMTILALIGAALFALNPSAALGVLGLPLLGFAIAPLFPALINSTERRIGAQHATNTIGFQIAATGLGAGVLQLVAGQIGERLSLSAIPVFLVIIAVIILILHEAILATTRRRQQE
jgi:fucose permease